jgi:hypothetical protein
MATDERDLCPRCGGDHDRIDRRELCPSGLQYASSAEFYANRPDRKRSREVDFGVWWQDGVVNWPRYRVSWVDATGEVVAVKMAGDESVVVLGVIEDEAELERRLDGWAEECGKPGSLEWVRERVR